MKELPHVLVGKKVRKNKDTWVPNEFDYWGRGDGVGEVVKPPFELDSEHVDVQWPNGRCFENIKELVVIDE